ncbi:hypothetical protein CC85DRAFT_269531 [Cutaneotrichosporon oleaginosum]|uniref:rRNA-processing protein n=1 Tax=Cutaneotrichosporon oleaginosum TaxID=879819 RepID=A0A0J1BB36_9TREE|nr:uncharacterized protein CC85DRAFT_269531 [Cutaneotrichosporon oleaginosum]KLT45174.1 hypothetical protein CC85DRAFT_269531 [Cutaneotrichosporon oleaginosum]TXT14989.1 hypothetical protein COLE_01182 [Cutaneotrichosporon oleaginosum]
MDVDAPTSTSERTSSTQPTAPKVLEVRPSKLGRSHGKAWKGEKESTRRTIMAPGLKSPFAKRLEQDKARQAVKAVEKEMKDEAKEEHERKVAAIRERRQRKAEKERLEQIAAKMSAKKLQRLRKVSVVWEWEWACAVATWVCSLGVHTPAFPPGSYLHELALRTSRATPNLEDAR